MSVRAVARRAAAHGPGTPGNAPIFVDSDDNQLKVVPAGSGTTELIVPSTVLIPLTAARTVTAAENGTVFTLGTAGGFTVTLPALPSATDVALHYTFFVKVAPTTDYIIASAAGNDIAGAVFSSSGGVEDKETAFTASQINFISSGGGLSKIGDSCELWGASEGWYSRSYCATAAGITYTG